MIKFTNSNYDFLFYINEQVNNLLGVAGRIYKENDKKYRLVFFRQNDIVILLNNIYENLSNSYLERKYKIFGSCYGFES